MQTRSITPTLSVAAQILPSEMQDVAKAGFKSIICNRPDGESSDQPTFAEVEAAAKSAGLRAWYIPVIPGKANDAEVVQFGKALVELPGPILAFCRSGARSTVMFEKSQLLRKSAASAQAEKSTVG